MTITDAVCQRLRTDPGVSTYVGTRVYQLKLPQQPTLPAIRVQLVAEPSMYHCRGPVNAWQALVQVDAFANEFDAAHPDPYDMVSLVADAIEASLSGAIFRIDPIDVTGSFRVSRAPLYDAEELRLARILQEYRLTYHRLLTTRARPEDLTTRREQRRWPM